MANVKSFIECVYYNEFKPNMSTVRNKKVKITYATCKR